MRLSIAGGCGDFGRSCFFVSGNQHAYIVDCGTSTDGKDRVPDLTADEIRGAEYLFLTHSHRDHTGAVEYAERMGFSGPVFMSAQPYRQLGYKPKNAVIMDSTAPEVELLPDFVLQWGRTGHCCGAVWYAITCEGKTAFFSGDYREGDPFYRNDPVRDLTADIAVISLGGTVVSTSIKTAGDDFDEALVRYMRKKHNLLIGERTAEEIKINIGAAYRRPELVTMEVRGRNLVTGLPKTIVVTSDETLEALKEPAMQIVDAVHNVLERTPPELAADIFDRGIVLTGGGSLLSGLDALIEEKTGITTMIAEEPLTAVAIGTGKFIEFAHGGKGIDK